MLLLSIFSSVVWAETPPNWIRKPPVEDNQFRYYVGRGSGKVSDSEKNIFDQANQDARETAISENFGIVTGIDRQSYSDLYGDTSVQRTNEVSKRVVLRGFQKVDQHMTETDGAVRLWVLFKYPKSEIQSEQRRLESESAPAPTQFSELSGLTGVGGGTVELVTVPPGCTVVIDQQSYGLSPARVRLEGGAHELEIDHPHFQTLTEQIVIQPGRVTRVSKTMTRAKRDIRIESTPDQAAVTLGGKFLGLTPVETTVATGERMTVLVTHDETQPYKSEIELGKGIEPFLLRIPALTPKPSYVAFNSTPQGADVFLNGRLIGKTPTGLIQADSGVLVMKKSGYMDEQIDLEMRGGQHQTWPTVKLTSLSEVEARELKRQRRIDESPFLVSFGMVFLGRSFKDDPAAASYGISLSLEKRFRNVGLKLSSLGLSYEDERDTQGNRYKMSGSSYAASVPIYFKKNVYAAPIAGQSYRKYSTGPAWQTQYPSYSVSQNFYGGLVGISGQSGQWGGSGEAGVLVFGDDGAFKGVASSLLSLNVFYAF